jgi:glycosyltransferase involved in cell wall biosynthesis
VFVGNFNHTPNEDAVLHFHRDILPLLWQQQPELQFHVVGANPPNSLRALASPHVVIHGFIDDLDRFLMGMQVSVVPLRFGAGMKGKVGSALRLGLPVVSTSIGVEGMPVQSGQEVIVADEPEAMATAILDVLTNPALWQQLSQNGQTFASHQWGERASYEGLRAILSSLGLPSSATPLHIPMPLYPFGAGVQPGQFLTTSSTPSA